MPPYSRVQPFSSIDVPDEDWDAAAAQWRESSGKYDSVAPELTGQPSDLPADGEDAAAALRQAQMPHWQWQLLRSRQLNGAPQCQDDGTSAGTEDAETLSGGDGADSVTANSSEGSSPHETIDPSRTDVFQKGVDGKLHPIEGWRTTGPFDFGTWRHDFNWRGVADDLGEIAVDAATFITPVGEAGSALRDGTAWNTGRMTAEAVRKQLRRRDVVPPGHEVHHVSELNGISRTAENWRNHPAFLKLLPKASHRRIHGRWGGLPRYNPVQRWWVGTPDWMKTVPAWIGWHAHDWVSRPSNDQQGMNAPGVPPRL